MACRRAEKRGRFSWSAFFVRVRAQCCRRKRVDACVGALANGSTCRHHAVPCSSRNQSQQEEEEYNVCIWKTHTHHAHSTVQCSRGRDSNHAMPWHHCCTYQDVAGFLPCGQQLARSRESPGSPFGRHAVPT